jgi:glucan phosphoethanolaminetransferase (alkaline phosphatase superfamily)
VAATGTDQSGLSTTTISCLGLLQTSQDFWSTRRIIRMTFSAIITLATLLLSGFLFYLIFMLSRSEPNPFILRLTLSVLIAAIALLCHSIIALILLSTDYNNFAFEIAMLWITEIIPYSLYVLLTSWTMTRRLLASLNESLSSSSRRSGSRRSGSRRGVPTRE